MAGVFVGSAALIIILSVFNGFERVILSMYNTFTPELRIEAARGKTFDPGTTALLKLQKDDRVANYTEVLEEKVLLRYHNGQYIATLRGVSPAFLKRPNLDSTLLSGTFELNIKGNDYAVVGAAIQSYLGINVYDDLSDIGIYSPRKGVASSINPTEEFNVRYIHPTGVFSLQQQYDENIIVSLKYARELLQEEKQVSYIELFLKPEVSVNRFKRQLEETIGEGYIVKDRMQQNALLYKVLNTEKWAIFVILTFVLVIAIFNLVGSLTMLVIDKKKDINILNSLGASPALIKKIFFLEGMMIAGIGCIFGMLCGLVFCLLQQHFGWIKMNDEANLIIDVYPIAVKTFDFVLVFFTVMIISAISSGISSRLSVKTLEDMKDNL